MAKRVDFQAMKDGNWIQDSLKRERDLEFPTFRDKRSHKFNTHFS